MEDARSKKGTPIAGARSPLGTLNTSTPSKRLYSKQKSLSKESVEATDDCRSSVDKLSQWLANESSKKQQHAVRSNVSSNTATPVRFRTTPKLKKEDVAATNEKRVSVKTLSSWMADDPFEQKKVRHIRTGAKVIAKSRIFEPTQTKNIAMNIEKGSVRNKQAWLSDAFKSETNNAAKRSLPLSQVGVHQKKKMKESQEKECTSVKDKKEWLKNAFKDSNNLEIIKSKSVDSGERTSFEIQKSASVDDDGVMYSNATQQTTISEAVKSVAKGGDRTTEEKGEEDNAVSVANRAKWLKSAFEKK
eukprot:scaffold5067_cov161-Skeletonema_menzelii.AAC.27